MARPRRRTAAGGRSAALWLACAALGGCSLFVPGEPTNIHCQDEGAVGPPACPSGTFCLEGLCASGPPALGAPCSSDGVCAPGDLCFDLGAVDLLPREICSRPCCSSADCGAGTDLVCAAIGPGNLCVPASLWDRASPRSGAAFAGEPCDTGSDCRSGACGADGACSDTCCSGAECGVFESTCRDEGNGWTCGTAAPGARPYLEPCTAHAECDSGLCVAWPDGPTRCSRPCCSSDECGMMKEGPGLASILCVPVHQGSTRLHACAAFATGPADRALGEPCDDPGQCRGGRCVETAAGDRVCSDVCCTDASCGAPHLFACAPVDPSGEELDLSCVPR